MCLDVSVCVHTCMYVYTCVSIYVDKKWAVWGLTAGKSPVGVLQLLLARQV